MVVVVDLWVRGKQWGKSTRLARGGCAMVHGTMGLFQSVVNVGTINNRNVQGLIVNQSKFGF